MQVSIEVEEFGNLTIGCLVRKQVPLTSHDQGLDGTHKLENGPEVDPTRVAQKSAIQSLLRVSRSVKSETNEEAADTPIVKAAAQSN